ncbi:3'-5' exonuclease [Methanobrevibacter sp. DSM 116169]|uniref:3'-5' exonuclease n=1 Tax=Methanobrevibacter sp. DSM 116169 TaxID=3242727 RepID=UPI0038FCC1B8
MEKINAVILDIDYITHNNKPVIRLFAKEPGTNKELIALDEKFVPYMYILPSDESSTLEEDLKDDFDIIDLEWVLKKDFQIETKFLKITFKHPQDLAKHRDEIRKLDSVKDIRETDIPFYRRYLIDNDIIPMDQVELTGEFIDSYETINSQNKDLKILKLESAPKKDVHKSQNFNILSFDLEVRNPHGMPNSNEDEIIMIGIASNFGLEKVISTKNKVNDSNNDFIERVKDEKAMIERFAQYVKEYDVDIIVGYNSDNFDFPYLKDRAKILEVDLNLGLDGSGLKFIRRGYANAAAIKGLIHVDLYLVMRRYMTLDRYTLERVYLELFGKEKVDVPGDKIWEYWDSDSDELDELFDYSLDDVKATIEIAEQILPLNLELTRIVGQPLFDLSRMATGQQAEWYLVKEAYIDNEVVPNKPAGMEFAQKKEENNEGGYVKEPEVGLHENLVQFDFRSLYPSIIISKNISPDVIVLNKDVDDLDNYNVSPEHGYKFKKNPKGFIPSVIGNVLNERSKIKKQMKESKDETTKKSLDVQQQALKRLANTMYGIYGFPRFRWYSFECAQAITAWGREYIKDSMKKAEEFGFETIYADTDGFYVKYVNKNN